MSGDKSRYSRPSTDSDEERKHFLNDHDGFIPSEAHVRQCKQLQRVLIAQWVVMGIFALILILIMIPMFLRNTKNYWIPNEIYCILFPCFINKDLVLIVIDQPRYSISFGIKPGSLTPGLETTRPNTWGGRQMRIVRHGRICTKVRKASFF